MSAQDVYSAVTSVQIAENTAMPCVRRAWAIGSAPELPWCVYYLDEESPFAADDSMYAKQRTWAVEHYYKDYSASIELALENAIGAAFGCFTKTETWIESEGCSQTRYTFTDID